MNIVKAGNQFQIYGSEISTYSLLPRGTYDVCFNKMTGFFLKVHDDLEVNEKVYGNSPKRVKKILDGFKNSTRNFGVILSGLKGAGKSMTVRLLAETSDYPVLLVKEPEEGLVSFIESIKQEVIVVFDEFEKSFKGEWNHGEIDSPAQDLLLSLFDGTDNGKKLFVITCNDVSMLSNYFKNRPGRFHYHFKYGLPTNDEIREYLEDNLNEEYKFNIKNILRCTDVADLSYDCLRAIVFELNHGYSLSETLNDLNIEIVTKRYKIIIVLSNGCSVTCEDRLTLFADDRFDFFDTVNDVGYMFRGNAKDAIKQEDGLITIPASDIEFELDSDYTAKEQFEVSSCVLQPIEKSMNKFQFLV